MTRVTVCVGSNVLDAQAFSRACQEAAALLVGDVERSSAYRTPDCSSGGGGIPYLNCVIRGTTPLGVDDLQARYKALERRWGRRPCSKASGLMPLDVDVVMADGATLRPQDAARQFFLIGYRQLAQTPAAAQALK